jgi:hypothetical protein
MFYKLFMAGEPSVPHLRFYSHTMVAVILW